MIDLSKADVLDKRWWIKVALVLDYVSRTIQLKLHEYKFQFNIALLDYNTENRVIQQHAQQAELLRNKMCSALLPWTDVGPQDMQQVYAQMRDEYVKQFGDPQDPAYQAEIQRLIDHWKSSRNKPKWQEQIH